MKKQAILTLFSLAALAVPLFCQNTATLAVTVRVEKRFRLEVNTSFISFTRTSSSGVPQTLPANEGPFQVKIKSNCSSSATTNVWFIPASDLVDDSTGFSIPVERISWQADGAGFYSGNLTKTAPALMARFMGPGVYEGNLRFFFDEDPGLAPGTYQTTVTILVEGV